MFYLVAVIYILLSLGQLERFSLMSQSVHIYGHELVIFIFICFSIWKQTTRKIIFQLFTTPMILGVMLFSMLLVLSLFLGWHQFLARQNLLGFLYFVRLQLYFAFLISLMAWLKEKKTRHEELTYIVYIFCWLVVGVSLLQYIFFPTLKNFQDAGWDPHTYRVFGSFFDTSFLGAVLSALFFFILEQKKKTHKKIVTSLLLLLIFFTYSRITYITFLAGFLYYFRTILSIRVQILFIIFFAACLFLLPRPSGESVRLERTATIKARAQSMQEGINAFKKHPLLGIGYNRISRTEEFSSIPDHARGSYPSSYLTILVASGVVGFLGMLFWMITTFFSVDRMGQTILMIFGVASLFDNVLFNALVLPVLTVFIVYSFKYRADKKL